MLCQVAALREPLFTSVLFTNKRFLTRMLEFIINQKNKNNKKNNKKRLDETTPVKRQSVIKK
jgi:hypothetical protein